MKIKVMNHSEKIIASFSDRSYFKNYSKEWYFWGAQLVSFIAAFIFALGSLINNLFVYGFILLLVSFLLAITSLGFPKKYKQQQDDLFKEAWCPDLVFWNEMTDYFKKEYEIARIDQKMDLVNWGFIKALGVLGLSRIIMHIDATVPDAVWALTEAIIIVWLLAIFARHIKEKFWPTRAATVQRAIKAALQYKIKNLPRH